MAQGLGSRRSFIVRRDILKTDEVVKRDVVERAFGFGDFGRSLGFDGFGRIEKGHVVVKRGFAFQRLFAYGHELKTIIKIGQFFAGKEIFFGKVLGSHG